MPMRFFMVYNFIFSLAFQVYLFSILLVSRKAYFSMLFDSLNLWICYMKDVSSLLDTPQEKALTASVTFFTFQYYISLLAAFLSLSSIDYTNLNSVQNWGLLSLTLILILGIIKISVVNQTLVSSWLSILKSDILLYAKIVLWWLLFIMVYIPQIWMDPSLWMMGLPTGGYGDFPGPSNGEGFSPENPNPEGGMMVPSANNSEDSTSQQEQNSINDPDQQEQSLMNSPDQQEQNSMDAESSFRSLSMGPYPSLMSIPDPSLLEYESTLSYPYSNSMVSRPYDVPVFGSLGHQLNFEGTNPRAIINLPHDITPLSDCTLRFQLLNNERDDNGNYVSYPVMGPYRFNPSVSNQPNPLGLDYNNNLTPGLEQIPTEFDPPPPYPGGTSSLPLAYNQVGVPMHILGGQENSLSENSISENGEGSTPSTSSFASCLNFLKWLVPCCFKSGTN